MEERTHKLIFKAGIARALLGRGVPIADIKPDRNNKDKTVFVFERTPKFEEVFGQINAEIKAKEKDMEPQ